MQGQASHVLHLTSIGCAPPISAVIHSKQGGILPRTRDTDRLIWLLQEQGRSSNRNIRTALKLSDERYSKIREELIDEKIIVKVKGQGGGIQLTPKGIKEKTLSDAQSSVQAEKDLYQPFVQILINSAEEDGEAAVVVDTSALRRTGKWSNPDVIKISIRLFPILRKRIVSITTYELKQWKRWNIDSVFEAASQRRFAHEAYVVLEWAKDEPVVGLEELMSVCARFGVGLITLHPHYNSFRYIIQLEPDKQSADEEYVEEFLGYVFEKNASAGEEFESLLLSQNV
jgi:hypothetical protein